MMRLCEEKVGWGQEPAKNAQLKDWNEWRTHRTERGINEIICIIESTIESNYILLPSAEMQPQALCTE